LQKELLERYLSNKSELIDRLMIHPRELHVAPSKDRIISIIGPRRTGKTYLFYGLMKDWPSKRYLYLNFEDIELQGISPGEILALPHLYEEIHGKVPDLILLDEVQVVGGWERAIRQLFEEKRYSILVTGSSSKMLSKEIATSLRGRSITQLLLPLTFREYLRFRNLPLKPHLSSSDEAMLKHELEVHLMLGGLPDVTIDPPMKAKILDNYRELVIYRDVIERHRIRNIPVLNSLVTWIISCFGNIFSIHKLYKTLDSQGMGVSKKTLYKYFDYLQDSLFVFPVWKFTWSPKKTKQTLPKIYLANTGIATNQMGDEKARLMENAVFLELLRKKDLEPDLGVFYWSDSRHEADFIVTKGPKPVSIIQVTYILTAQNRERELGGLLKASADLGCKDLNLITWDQEGTETFKGMTIQKVPLFKWLLEKS
jgi:uncharacterized protein